MPQTLAWYEILIALLTASACGALIGWERELHAKPAGLRTHMLVALGAAAFSLVTVSIAISNSWPDGARIDPLRVVAGVIGGIGFLGAGSIIRSRGSVDGLTTAASIWVAGSLGVACGVGRYLIAAMTVGLAYFVLAGLGRMERRVLADNLKVNIESADASSNGRFAEATKRRDTVKSVAPHARRGAGTRPEG